MTQEEIAANLLKPKEPTYEDYLNQWEQLPDFSPAQAAELWKSSRKPILETWMENNPNPRQRYTPEQEKRARYAASITDSLSTLAELFAHGRGGTVRNRGGNTSVKNTDARFEKFRDEYEKDIIRYNSGKYNAELQDFSTYMRAMQDGAAQNRKALEHRMNRAMQLEQAAAKQAADEAKYRRDQDAKLEAEDRKYQRDKDLIRERARYRSSGGGGGGTGRGVSGKNVFEIPVSPDTQGAEYDDFTGKYYIKTQIPKERQASILASLPGGKHGYVAKNKLYKSYSHTDDFGKESTSMSPFTDEEIVRWYLENDYMARPNQQWKIPKQTGWNPQGGGQPKFNHSPY